MMILLNNEISLGLQHIFYIVKLLRLSRYLSSSIHQVLHIYILNQLHNAESLVLYPYAMPIRLYYTLQNVSK